MTSPSPVVVLANGAFPVHPIPLGILRDAKTLVCTDGSRDRALEAGLSPTLTVGDLDSLDQSRGPGDRVRREASQENTDLEKTLQWCVENKIPRVAVVGMAGGREDHALANFYILANFAHRLEVTAVTDHFTILPVRDQRTFAVHPGRRISLMPIVDSPVVSTEGLRYPLNRESLVPGGRGISNRATGDSFSISVRGGCVLVFIQHPE